MATAVGPAADRSTAAQAYLVYQQAVRLPSPICSSVPTMIRTILCKKAVTSHINMDDTLIAGSSLHIDRSIPSMLHTWYAHVILLSVYLREAKEVKSCVPMKMRKPSRIAINI